MSIHRVLLLYIELDMYVCCFYKLKAVIWAKSEGLIVCGGEESNEGSSEHKPPSHAALQGNVTSTCNVKTEFAEFLKLS